MFQLEIMFVVLLELPSEAPSHGLPAVPAWHLFNICQAHGDTLVMVVCKRVLQTTRPRRAENI